MNDTGRTQESLLVRAALGGNHAAFEQLLHFHDRAVWRLASRIMGSQSDVQDISQEAFLRAYKNLGSFRFECSFATWIHRIVTNVCLDHLRKARNRKENSSIEVNDRGEECDLLNHASDDRPSNNPERELLSREMGGRISHALRKLAPRERMVFELKHVHGMKLQAVSEILNTSHETTKSALFRAKQKLRRQLASCSGEKNSRYGPL